MAFDRNKILTVAIQSGGRKACSVRYPTDAEWCARARSQKNVRQQIGRGKTKPVPQHTEAMDAKLFAAIRQDVDGMDFTAVEAAAVVSALDQSKVDTVEFLADRAIVAMTAGSEETVHELRLPTKDQTVRHDRGTWSRVDSRNMSEVRIFLEASGDLYDELFIQQSGYAGDGLTAVPIDHKFSVIFELLADLERLEQEDPELLTLVAGRNTQASGS